MENKKDLYQSLEGFRTDHPVDGRAEAMRELEKQQPFYHKSWIKKSAVTVVFLLFVSLSLTVYAFSGNQSKANQSKANQLASWEIDQEQADIKPDLKLQQKQGSSKSDEAIHLEYIEKPIAKVKKSVKKPVKKPVKQLAKKSVKKSAKKSTKKSTKKRQQTIVLSLPPQPKKQDKPALNDQPMQMPDHLK